MVRGWSVTVACLGCIDHGGAALALVDVPPLLSRHGAIGEVDGMYNPPVKPAVYRDSYKTLDRDKDGTMCEVPR